MERRPASYLLEEAARVLADLRKAGYDVVEVEVRQRGMVAALPLHLEQQQVPAVERGQDALLLPGNTHAERRKKRLRDADIFRLFSFFFRRLRKD